MPNLHYCDTFFNQKHYSRFMFDHLRLYNLDTETELDLKRLDGRVFGMQTCQRILLITMEPSLEIISQHHTETGENAYQYLLEIICGLKSRLIGENEIVSQFKLSYQNYLKSSQRDNRLILVLEKLFKDAKAIRSQYLNGISQKTYASITRKLMMQQNNVEQVVILGSGQLAQDLINQFSKCTKVLISARDYQKLALLQNIENCHILPWKTRQEFFQYPFICNTIGFDGILYSEDFFNRWQNQNQKKFFIDLGAPSCIKTNLQSDQNVLRLSDILSEGAVKQQQQKEQIEAAQKAIIDLASSRTLYLRNKLSNGSENTI